MDNKKTAILIMDMQMAMLGRLPENGNNVVTKVGEAVKTARENGVLPIFVRLGYQNGMPELSPKNKLFYGLKSMTDEQLHAFMEIHPGTGYTEKDILVNKKRVSAFSGNDLEMILQSAGIEHLVLCGVSTSGIVLSTLCSAFDKDYQITVLSDACEDMDPETHIHMIEKIFPKHATVTSVADWK
jgi:nicotinamidase-related amidase